MTFHDLTFDKDISEMDEGELRATLSEFQTKHRENAEYADDLASKAEKYEDKADELDDKLSEYSGLDEDLAEQFSELVAEESTLFTADEIRSRYSTLELVEKAEEMGVFSIPEESEADENPDGEGGEFEEKPQKSPGNPGTPSEFREDAERDLDRVLGGAI